MAMLDWVDRHGEDGRGTFIRLAEWIRKAVPMAKPDAEQKMRERIGALPLHVLEDIGFRLIAEDDGCEVWERDGLEIEIRPFEPRPDPIRA